MSTDNLYDVKLRINGCISISQAIEKFADPFGLVKSCLNCTRFDEPNAFCNKYNGKPPPRVIAFACEGHEDIDDIPF